jgi:ribonuclease R
MPEPAGPRDSFVGVLARRGRFMVAEPLFERAGRVSVDARRAHAGAGEIALVRVVGSGRGARGEVERTLGRPDVARDVLEALLVERGYARRFAGAVEREAQEAAADEDHHRRRDLTALATFTIDPPQARDFDDAVSVESDGDGLRLWVHIADVAAHVRPGTALDGEAERRGNSVYAPHAVEPMLPHSLSSDACSLVPGLPRKAVTVELRVNGSGEVSERSFYRGLIRSDARLDYEQVEEMFAGHAHAPDSVAAPLARARALAATLRQRRLARGALGLETSEPEFELDSEGHVVRAFDNVQTESHTLIEELMILANEQVARELARRRKSTLYRVHEQPEPAAIEFLAAQLESLDVPTPPIPRHLTPRVAGELAGMMAAKVADHVQRTGRGRNALTSLVLRALKQAFYSPNNVGHAGLASAMYTHFTSPIRRYPDLVVHRALLAAVGAGEEPPPAHSLGELGWHCSQTERAAMALERDADDVCFAFLVERRMFERGWGQEFEGEVSGVIGGGAFVSFAPGSGTAACEGFLPVRRLRGDYWELNEEGTALVGRESSRSIRLGDPLTVAVRAVDPPRGRIDLEPAADREPPASETERENRQDRRPAPERRRS